MSSKYVINDRFQPILSNSQGFDRCVPPTIDQLAAWWSDSPYSVVNIYLGGIHFPAFCQTGIQDAFWVHAAATQGWGFTAIWVGPQPPCSDKTHRFSLNPDVAYQEGREESGKAADRARELGLFGDITIHYDIEGYADEATTACRVAVNAFLQGWTDRLQELDLRAGAYGGGCSSFITDWAENDPIIDQVWIAHWQWPPAYNPNATVWNATCVSNSLWANQQRLKQYSGDHGETWGGVSITIDSNVFDTDVIGWGPEALTAGANGALAGDFGPLGSDSGWLQLGGRLYRTDDLGSAWVDITPPGFTVLGAAFPAAQTGFAAGWPDGTAQLHLGKTGDGGATWEVVPLEAAGDPGYPNAAKAFIEVLDEKHIWVAVKLPSGSAFSLGRLFASTDGGATWIERTHPLGEPVVFETPSLGWTAGGPAGVSAFRTLDGGATWTAADPAAVPHAPAGFETALPPGTIAAAYLTDTVAWALVQEGSCTGEKGSQDCRLVEKIWVTRDRGANWSVIPHPETGG